MSNLRQISPEAATVLQQDEQPQDLIAAPRIPGIADIAVHVDGSARDEDKIRYAEALAVAAGAHLSIFFGNEIISSPLTSPGSEWVIAEVWKQAAVVGNEIEERLKQRLALVEPTTDLRRNDAILSELILAAARSARVCDLFVCGRPYGTERHWPEIVEAVLFDESAPVLIVPPSFQDHTPPATVVVGWRDTAECAHAITAALPFLKAAEHVHLASIADSSTSDEEQHREPMADMARHLARHGVEVEIRHLPHWDRPGEGLINEAKLLGADLIVAGAYGHTRFREWILGGATRELLTDSPVPLLLCH
ncbi:universal stress protein [Mangrovicella endophytica]|uniref:universal stress protein n=1 Tax=Mangrovicella endophytica TaxID=2066697 RepID=UPI000C9EBC57|nr:universal stress protein [Mangrovicella endophytica]